MRLLHSAPQRALYLYGEGKTILGPKMDRHISECSKKGFMIDFKLYDEF